MPLLRRTFLAAVLAGGVLIAASVPGEAGVTLLVTGTATCDTATGTTTINWSILSSSSAVTVVATQTPTGQTLTVTPNPIPVGPNGMATATGTVPGTTVGTVTLTLDDIDSLNNFTGTVDVTACVAAAAAVEAPADFTG
jgi:hypothetical protein